MNNNSIITRFTASSRRKGLILIIAASLVLLVLALYKVPLFHNEHHGIVTGISEVHAAAGSQFIASVQLATGERVIASMPEGLLKSESIDVMVDEGRSLFGHKSYRIIQSGE